MSLGAGRSGLLDSRRPSCWMSSGTPVRLAL
ncbi:hypothetical protein AvCA_23760 [Azotobacter vinelandii CA]|uniref:Uncharacterized protein n=2 Tax=Azotobacter vinelandii TaxID=354 RepID=C1DHG8_AZOVD|nr:hypothetical protein Avin_23760 [Azotobacter vinelandii DJ]AGK14975.1 hypothetical protein AvCA_23760 [Azotobacter vinelandii CA]AGK20586.1 hypothetical protein AvCA6_23760 [Azotobacter vinelandii CA6]